MGTMKGLMAEGRHTIKYPLVRIYPIPQTFTQGSILDGTLVSSLMSPPFPLFPFPPSLSPQPPFTRTDFLDVDSL